MAAAVLIGRVEGLGTLQWRNRGGHAGRLQRVLMLGDDRLEAVVRSGRKQRGHSLSNRELTLLAIGLNALAEQGESVQAFQAQRCEVIGLTLLVRLKLVLRRACDLETFAEYLLLGEGHRLSK